MKLFKKSVALAGYKNKQCRKQTSVLSGRIVTAYVPLRSATERERAAFLIPCQGLRDYFTNFQFTILLVHTDNAGDFPHDGHSLHDTDGIIKMSLFYEIGDDHDLGNAIVAALLYHLGDADIVVAKDSCDICQGSGTILHL